MNKELQNKVWKILPKEFKEEVKAHYAGLNAAYKAYLSKDSLSNEECDRCNVLREKIALYQMYFGYRNLTSDAEGEEMLTVKAKTVREMYAYNAAILSLDPTHKGAILLRKKLQKLFGSKCLPEEEPLFSNQPENYNNENPIVANDNKSIEPKFKVGDKVRIVNDWHYGQKYRGKTSYITHVDESDPKETYKVDIYDKELGGELWYYAEDLEPYTSQDPIPPISGELKPQTAETQLKEERTEPTFTDDCPSQDHFVVNNEMVDDIINQSFADHNRLHIAAMAMAGLLANDAVSCFTDVQELEHMDFITYHALEYADKLIKHAKKGGQDA